MIVCTQFDQFLQIVCNLLNNIAWIISTVIQDKGNLVHLLLFFSFNLFKLEKNDYKLLKYIRKTYLGKFDILKVR